MIPKKRNNDFQNTEPAKTGRSLTLWNSAPNAFPIDRTALVGAVGAWKKFVLLQ